MAVTAPTVEQIPAPRFRTGGPPTPRPESWWVHLLGAFAWLNRTVEVVALIERVGPSRSAEVARRWLGVP